MKKKLIIGIVVACLLVAGIATTVVIKNHRTTTEDEVQASSESLEEEEESSNESVNEETLASDASMDQAGEAEDETATSIPGGYTEEEMAHYIKIATENPVTSPLSKREEAAWAIYQAYYDDFSVYGPDFNEYAFAYPMGTSGTGYDSSLLVEKTTDKGCGCYVDTATGKVYYNGMILPDGGNTDLEDHGAFLKWVLEDTDGRGECTVSTITYAQMQEIYGYPVN